jgi:homoserine kinase type II
VYQNTSDPRRVGWELDLLRALNREDLPFAVPRPVATLSGETFVAVSAAQGTVVATLFPFIPGRHPRPGSASHAAMSGAALGQLDRVLARIAIPPSLVQPTFCDIFEIQPEVPDLDALLAAVPVARSQRSRVDGIVRPLLEAIPNLATTMPRQIIHADFGKSNVLLADGRVTGILDFEFAGPDLRPMDLVCGLWAFSIFAWGSGREWPLLTAFARGYLGESPLNVDEIEALPALIRLRDAVALAHWIGRWRQGLAIKAEVSSHIADLLTLDDWLNANHNQLIHLVLDASRP